jgi:hypothetical protein
MDNIYVKEQSGSFIRFHKTFDTIYISEKSIKTITNY